MNILDYQGPFLGFTFCGEHSSKFKIVRINSSGKGELPLTPNFKDNFIERTNGDGSYYFSTNDTDLTFNITFGFDRLTEKDLQALRNFLSSKKYGEIIFDEAPYKKYMGKLKQAASLSYIAFDEDLLPAMQFPKRPDFDENGNLSEEAIKQMIEAKKLLYGPNEVEHTERIYKGEGSIQFVCYYPYGVAPYQTIEEYETQWIGKGYTNINEWRAASRIMSYEQYVLYNHDIIVGESTELNNVGDLDTSCQFDLMLTDGANSEGYIEIVLRQNEETVSGLLIKTNLLENNKIYHFDSEKKLITDEDGNFINYAIVAGDFFNIPTGLSQLSVYGNNVDCTLSNIKYEYRYL